MSHPPTLAINFDMYCGDAGDDVDAGEKKIGIATGKSTHTHIFMGS